MPSRNVITAAGRPATWPSTSPALFLTGCGQVMPRACRCSIRPRKNGRSLGGHAPLVEREDEIAAAGVDQEVRVLDAFGDALVGEQFADVVAGEKGRELFRRDVGVDGHAYSAASVSLSTRGSGKNMLFLGGGHGLHAHRIALGEGADDLLDQDLRRRGAGGDAEASDRAEHRPVDLGGALHQRRARTARALCDLLEPLGVGGVGRADHDHRLDHGRHLLHHLLAVGGGVADVFLVRAMDLAESALSAPRRYRRCRRPTAWSASHRQDWRDRAARTPRPRSTDWTSVMAPRGSWPTVPTTSGWSAWPISTISRPRL